MIKQKLIRCASIFSIIIAISLLIFNYAQKTHAANNTNPNNIKNGPTAFLLAVNGAIGPASQDFIQRGIEKAQTQGASLFILRMDTPGGLDKSMRGIIKAILASPVPIVTFVAPSGARAASAGTYILYASNIAAMAPGTNLGAATPVSISGGGGGFPGTPKPDQNTNKDKDNKNQQQKTATAKSAKEKKVTNDAIAYIRSLAQLRGRNVKWAEKSVREAATLSARDALKANVIDLIAKNIPDLLKKINGRKITNQGITRTLNTDGMVVIEVKPDWRTKLLSVITDPSVAYILLLLGAYGIFFEFANPGFVVPGVAGAIALILALYAFQLLPIDYTGLALMLLGIIFMVMEAFMPSFGALGIGGIIAFVIGSILLMDTQAPGWGIPWSVIITMTIVNALFFIFVIGMAIKARRRSVVSGGEAMIGRHGEIIFAEGKQGKARVGGEIWNVFSKEILQIGQQVEVEGMDGLLLEVRILESNEGET